LQLLDGLFLAGYGVDRERALPVERPFEVVGVPTIIVDKQHLSYTANGKNRASDHTVREKGLFRGRISLAGEILWWKINGEWPHKGRGSATSCGQNR
jgi:hypothetical protein